MADGEANSLAPSPTAPISEAKRVDWGRGYTAHTYTNFNTIEHDFVYLENLNNILIDFVVNH